MNEELRSKAYREADPLTVNEVQQSMNDFTVEEVIFFGEEDMYEDTTKVVYTNKETGERFFDVTQSPSIQRATALLAKGLLSSSDVVPIIEHNKDGDIIKTRYGSKEIDHSRIASSSQDSSLAVEMAAAALVFSDFDSDPDLDFSLPSSLNPIPVATIVQNGALDTKHQTHSLHDFGMSDLSFPALDKTPPLHMSNIVRLTLDQKTATLSKILEFQSKYSSQEGRDFFSAVIKQVGKESQTVASEQAGGLENEEQWSQLFGTEEDVEVSYNSLIQRMNDAVALLNKMIDEDFVANN